VHDDNENPDFDDEISFELVPEKHSAKVMVMDSNLISDSEYGHVEVDLSPSVQSGQSVEVKDHALKDTSNKEVQGTLSFDFVVEGGEQQAKQEEENIEMAQQPGESAGIN